MHKLQFLRLVTFSSHWLIATVVTGSGTLHHHYTHTELIATGANWGYSGTWGQKACGSQIKTVICFE